MFIILTFDFTAVLKTAANTRQRKQATSKETNETFIIYIEKLDIGMMTSVWPIWTRMN